MLAILIAFWRLLVEVARFWYHKLYQWYMRQRPVDLWLHLLQNATTYEEWYEAAIHLDNLLGLDLWRNNPVSRHYDYRLIHERLQSLLRARDIPESVATTSTSASASASISIPSGVGTSAGLANNLPDLPNNLPSLADSGTDYVPYMVHILRSGLVRNLGNVTALPLYHHAFAGSKYLIEEYVDQVVETITAIGALPTSTDATRGPATTTTTTAKIVAGEPPSLSSSEEEGQAMQLRKRSSHSSHISHSNNPSQNHIGHNHKSTNKSTNKNKTKNNHHNHHNSRNRLPRNHSHSSLRNSDRSPQSSRQYTYPHAIPLRPRFTLTTQMKLDFMHDTRQAFGRSSLVLQGGSLFGMYHVGVVKALLLRGLLPRIITGSATGALIAALVGIHTEDELPQILTGEGIDLSAFGGPHAQTGVVDQTDLAKGTKMANTKTEDTKTEDTKASSTKPAHTEASPGPTTKLWMLYRRARHFWQHGNFMDQSILEACIRANIGDVTFEEAYRRTRRILNITIAVSEEETGLPTLLNYLTAPHVLIWTAALASNAGTIYPPSSSSSSSTTPSPTPPPPPSTTTSQTTHAPTILLCKDAQGRIQPWTPTLDASVGLGLYGCSGSASSYPPSPAYSERHSPLMRVAELFNVNHFIVSQARPYLIPFVQSDITMMHGPLSMTDPRKSRFTQATSFLLRMVGWELRHRLRQLDQLRLIPATASVRRFLVDQHVPGAAITLVPEVGWADFGSLFLGTDRPQDTMNAGQDAQDRSKDMWSGDPRSSGPWITREQLEYWILRGERSVWPAVAALHVRCAIEHALDREYQQVRQLKADAKW